VQNIFIETIANKESTCQMLMSIRIANWREKKVEKEKEIMQLLFHNSIMITACPACFLILLSSSREETHK